MHRFGAAFERDRGGVEGRGGAADHRDVLAGERGEIDVVAGMGAEAARQIAEQVGDREPPLPSNPVAMMILRAVSTPVLRCSGNTPPPARYAQAGAVAHRDTEEIAVPGEIVDPGLARDALERA